MSKFKRFGFVGWCIIGWLVFVVVLIALHISESNAWSKYAQEHNCQATGKTKLKTTIVPVSNGNGGTMMIPTTVTKHEYTCDNNTIHWR